MDATRNAKTRSSKKQPKRRGASPLVPLAGWVNRELSHLDFQRRVLAEAEDPRNPLLERVRFWAIFHSNMDEFFMVRVAGLIGQVQSRRLDRFPDGLGPAEVLAAVRRTARELFQRAQKLWRQELLPSLAEHGIEIVPWKRLTRNQQHRLTHWFEESVFPVLTPLAFDPGHPFPHISNLSLNLAVLVRDEDKIRFARIKVPEIIPRLVPVKRSSGGLRRDGSPPAVHRFVFLEEVIQEHLEMLFPGLEVVSSYMFHIARDADITIQEIEAGDLLETVEESVRQRRFGSVVRLLCGPDTPKEVQQLLLDNLEVDRRDLYVMQSPLGGGDLKYLADLPVRPLRYRPFQPYLSPALVTTDPASFFDGLAQGDLLLHHPYDSFVPVVEFLRMAARDPQVRAIKQTLYRVGRNSPIVEALLEARERGKQVGVLVELKARFDEEPNIEWARRLEEAGVHVSYGLVGLKTHCKVALVVREEGDRIRRYIHLATGNYNPVTARVYEDVGMFTCDPDIGADVTDLFNALTGYSRKQDYRRLLVAPVNLRSRLEQLIRRETAHARANRKAHVIFKCNALVDPTIIRLIAEAVSHGVDVDLIVRSICCMTPAMVQGKGRLRIRSVLGRFLEHSRIYWFRNGGNEEIWVGSADLMPRNLDHRVEVLFPVTHPRYLRYLRDEVLERYLASDCWAWELQPDGTWRRNPEADPGAGSDVQEALLRLRESWTHEPTEPLGKTDKK